MGKRGGKRRGDVKFVEGNTKEGKTQDWKGHKDTHENNYFRRFYELQFEPYFRDNPQEFNTFWERMKVKLPVVFRLNPNQPNHAHFKNKILSEEFIESHINESHIKQTHIPQEKLQQTEFEPEEIPKLEQVEWYPGQLVYCLNTNKQILKKSKVLAELHTLIQNASNSGLVTRQEIVSMLPPLYLDIQPTDRILDMCAAPGSKTSQMLEMLYGEKRSLVQGCVIANDVQYNRASMLIHQIQRAGTVGIAVINHNAQFLPQLYNKDNGNKEKITFHKVLCDVPCSGDGATRKLPNKWANWHSRDGMSLHPLQLNILMRGINNLAADGLLLYSTCSLSPIEDEAVVLEVLRRASHGLELVDIHDRYSVKGRRGLLDWKVCLSKGRETKDTDKVCTDEQLFTFFPTYETAEKLGETIVKSTMFPEEQEVMKKYGIHHTMRMLPHDENSGGFYLALFRKSKDFEWKYNDKKAKTVLTPEEQEKLMTENMEKVQEGVGLESDNEKEEGGKLEGGGEGEGAKIEEGQKPISKESSRKKKEKVEVKEDFIHLQEEEYQNIKEFYGLKDDTLRKLLFVRPTNEGRKKVTLVSKGVSEYLFADDHKKLKLINMGCKAFQKGKESFSGSECLYRLCQDGLPFILSLLSKRKVKVTLEVFKQFITNQYLKHAQILDQQVRQELSQIPQGSFAVYISETLNGKLVEDCMAAQNFKSNLNIMISKEDIENLKLRYL